MQINKYAMIKDLLQVQTDFGIFINEQGQLQYPDVVSNNGSILKLKVKLYTTSITIEDQTTLNILNEIKNSNLNDFLIYLLPSSQQSKNITQGHLQTIQISKTGKVCKGKEDTIVTQGKNIGKVNETSIFQQILQEAHKKLQQWKSKKNQQIYPQFMLLDLYKYQGQNIQKKENTKSNLKFPQFVQKKYDGLRCGGVFKSNINKIVLLSRGFKEFTTLEHIEKQLTRLREKLLLIVTQKVQREQVEILFDGELYTHGKSLQHLNSIIRGQNNQKECIKFTIFDIDITTDNFQQQVPVPFVDKFQILQEANQLIQEDNLNSLHIAETLQINNDTDLNTTFFAFISQNYEGAVIRSPESIYTYSINNKRSKDSLKYKLKLDMEVQVVDFTDGCGKDKNAIIFICKTDMSNQTFQVINNITYDNRKTLFELLTIKSEMFQILKKIPLNIEYAVLSDRNIPQQPRGIYFRTEMIPDDIHIPEELMKLISI